MIRLSLEVEEGEGVGWRGRRERRGGRGGGQGGRGGIDPYYVAEVGEVTERRGEGERVSERRGRGIDSRKE